MAEKLRVKIVAFYPMVVCYRREIWLFWKAKAKLAVNCPGWCPSQCSKRPKCLKYSRITSFETFKLSYSADKYPKGYLWDSKTSEKPKFASMHSELFFRTKNFKKLKGYSLMEIWNFSESTAPKNPIGGEGLFGLVYFCKNQKMSIVGFELAHPCFTATCSLTTPFRRC